MARALPAAPYKNKANGETVKKILTILVLVSFTFASSGFGQATRQAGSTRQELARKQALLDYQADHAGVGSGSQKVSKLTVGFNLAVLSAALTSVTFFVGSVGLSATSSLRVQAGLASQPIFSSTANSLAAKSFGIWQFVMTAQAVFFVRDVINIASGRSDDSLHVARYVFMEE